MLNKIWFWLLVIGVLYGLAKGVYRTATADGSHAGATSQPAGGESRDPLQPLRNAGKELTDSALGAARTAVELCIVLIGMMALWLGMLNIAKDAGLVDALARSLRPAMRWLFPDVPDGHPAQGAMLMNISANMFGLGNAATPFGLKAMRELQTLNPTTGTATNAMAMFLSINTSSVTIIPFTIIGLRSAAGSANAAAPLGGILIATTISTATAIVACRMLSRRPGYAMPLSPVDSPAAGGTP